MKFEDLIGQRFTRLIVTARAESNKHGHTKWQCQCDCGNNIIAYASDLKRGGRPSCGCLKSEKLSESRKLLPGQSGLNNMFAQYKKGAKNRNLVFSLTSIQFAGLIDKSCHYCGAGPSLKAFSNNRMKLRNVNGNFLYTGIDRKNSAFGYQIDNCVTCCKTCNFAKNNMSYIEFIAYIDSLVAYRSTLKQEQESA